MNYTERTAKPAFTSKTGLFAMLCGLLRTQVIVALATTLGALAFTAAPALAAAPQVLSESAPSANASEARLAALVNPENEVTECHFQYGKVSVSEHEVQCEQPLIEGEEQGVAVNLTGLTQTTSYHYRVILKNLAAEEAVGPPQSFTTATPPQTPKTEAATGPTATTAILHGELNPTGEAETGYHFLYSTGATCAAGGTDSEAVAQAKVKANTKVEAKVEGLQPNAKYTFCLVATNSAGEAVESTNELEFETPAAPPTVESVSAPKVTATAVTLEGAVNPNNESTECRFQYGTTSVSENEVACNPELLTGFGPHGVSSTTLNGTGETVTSITDLLQGTTYKYRLLAKNLAGEESKEGTFATMPLTVGNENSPTVTGGEAEVSADIGTAESAAKYYVQYGTNSVEELSTPEVSVPGSSTPAKVEQRLGDLQPATTYSFRFVASDGHAPVIGEERTFTTSAAPVATVETCPNAQLRAEQPFGLTLPDCRAYEIVSPVETNGQDATDSFVASGPRASLSGDAVTFASKGSFAGAVGVVGENQMISRRGADGWSTQAITPSHEPDQTESAPSYEATAFTPELTYGIADSNASLTPEAPTTEPSGGSRVQDLYLTKFEVTPHESPYVYLGLATDPMGISTEPATEISHVVFGEGGQVSEWADGVVAPVGIANDGTIMESSVGSQARNFSPGYDRDKNVWQAVSSDGSDVVFTSPATEASSNRQVYVRVNTERPQSPMNGEECTVAGDACTVEVSASQRGTLDPHGPQSARYWGASEHGGKVFFTSSAELTDDAYTGTEDNAANLYEYDLNDHTLTDLTVDPADVAAGPAVQGVVQISEDGAYVYFVADGALASGATPQTCTGAGTGEGCNLYLSHDNETTLIATLSLKDQSDWDNGGAYVSDEAGPAVNTAVVNPGGSELAFVSERSLTGYDNTQREHGRCENEFGYHGETETGRCREVFLYEAETHGLVCPSCNSNGPRPIGPSDLSELGSHYAFTEYRARALLTDGRLFFNSSDALVPHSSDGRQNVYEYEDGHVYAISNVAGGYESFFMDASPSGNDVFLGSADRLLADDTSSNVMVWDARIDGGFPVTAPPPSCASGDSCKPPESPQPSIYGVPASATFSGTGNLAPAPPAFVPPKPKTAAQVRAQKLAAALRTCRRDKKRAKRIKCEKQARKKYGATKKSTHDKGSK